MADETCPDPMHMDGVRRTAYNKSLDTFLSETKYSCIEEEFPDKNKFPLYYEASKIEITIEAGEMLFIPAGWFHFVFSEDVDKETGLNFAINYWYYSHPHWSPRNPSIHLPKHMGKHNLPNLNPRNILGGRKHPCTRTELNGLFPSNRLFQHNKSII